MPSARWAIQVRSLRAFSMVLCVVYAMGLASTSNAQNPPATTGVETSAQPKNTAKQKLLQAKLDVSGIKRFLAVLNEAQTVAKVDSEANEPLTSQPAEFSDETTPTPFTDMISDSSTREIVDPIANKHGFAGATEWARYGDRLALAIAVVEAIRSSKLQDTEIDAVRICADSIHAAFASGQP